ncbi:MAG: SDR family NAD(P)-dependent oxidoreductase [Chloroflexi bacterium]|nr:SDR family NAD(P)-dependent oxidoreductase [Chloroflexota bacterium]
MSDVTNFFDFKGKVVLVTGSGKGIGHGIAMAFASAGATLALHYHLSKFDAEETAACIRKAGHVAQTFHANIKEEKEVECLFQEVEQNLGGPDVLINNAGLAPQTEFISMPTEQWDQVVNVNLRSVFLTSRVAARHMLSQIRLGVIINIGSIEGDFPAFGHAHYSASKAGVLMLTQSCALELGPSGIRVNSVSPGLIERDGIQQDWPEGIARWMKAATIKRLGTTQDVANACLFLASQAASWITGANLVVDGGVSCRPAF